MKVKQISVNGTPYLAKMTIDGENVTLTEAMSLQSPSVKQEDFVQYLQSKNLGTLGTVEFSGRGIAYSVCPLSEKQKLDFKIVRLNMARAKVVALPELENRKLEQLLGK